MDDDSIADITATLRFDRAILLFWFLLLSDNQSLTILFYIYSKIILG
jgi:hypothetical protein